MHRMAHTRQRWPLAFAVAALFLALALAACGSSGSFSPSSLSANVSNTTSPATNSSNSTQTPSKTQQNQPATTNASTGTTTSTSTSSSTTNSGIQNTDQQVQSLMQQLDGAQGDVNNADAGATQDSNQPGTLVPATSFTASPSTTTTKCASTDTQCFITLGDQLIAARQAALNILNGKVTIRLNQQLITSDEASVLQSDISTNQQGLTALQTKLNGETSASAAKQDVQNIFVQFRIYAVVLPRDYRRLYLDVAHTVDTKLRGLAPQLQQAIKNAPASEQPQLQSLYNDYTTQLGTAEGQFDAAANDIVALTPENFNDTRTSYASTLANLKISMRTIHSALHQATLDVHQIAQILKDK